MKVKDILRKINIGTSSLPVYLQRGAMGYKRAVRTEEFINGACEEEFCTVRSISLLADRIIIHYS